LLAGTWEGDNADKKAQPAPSYGLAIARYVRARRSRGCWDPGNRGETDDDCRRGVRGEMARGASSNSSPRERRPRDSSRSRRPNTLCSARCIPRFTGAASARRPGTCLPGSSRIHRDPSARLGRRQTSKRETADKTFPSRCFLARAIKPDENYAPLAFSHALARRATHPPPPHWIAEMILEHRPVVQVWCTRINE